MTNRTIVVIGLACSLATARAVDINELPTMDDFGWPKIVELKGREVEAIDAALRQFREDHFSISGDLKHFTVELKRQGDKAKTVKPAATCASLAAAERVSR